MSNFDEVIAKSIELNDAINKLNAEAKVLKAIVAEKKEEKKKEIINDLQKYVVVMEKLDIDVIQIKTESFGYCFGRDRRLGIKIRKWSGGVQIDLGCYHNNFNDEFSAYHSIGNIVSGYKNDIFMTAFCEKWSEIKSNLDVLFAKKIEAILENRKEKAFNERECAISVLTAINQ